MTKLTVTVIFALAVANVVDAMNQTASCTRDGQCQRGACCSGKAHTTFHCGVGFCESMCEKVVDKMIKKGAIRGCAEIIGEGDAICEAVGLGPEDPLADICAATVTIGCPIVAHELAKKVTNPKELCQKIGLCKCNGKRCGCLKDGQCTDSTGDCCSGKSHHTAACGALTRCGAKPSASTAIHASKAGESLQVVV